MGFVGGHDYPSTMSFKYVDLFAGIGGFHAALSALGGSCEYASEIDENASRIYLRNWGVKPSGDITLAANEENMDVPSHDVLVGGFPCQPFSKSGKQLGMEEARGTLFWNIARIIEVHKPKIVLLENVRNIAGPRHTHEWDVIIRTLRDLGYRVSSQPLVVSPHRIAPEFGGRPQFRERVLIAATLNEKSTGNIALEPEKLDLSKFYDGWDPQDWRLKSHLPIVKNMARSQKKGLQLTESELRWLEAWNEFIVILKNKLGENITHGFPLWADEWVHIDELVIPRNTPEWKRTFLTKNAEFYTSHKKEIDRWLKKWNNLEDFPPSRRKFEWQAQDAKDLWSTVLHFRPSGIRAKKPTYVPALVAMTQTSVLASQKRRLSVREAARLQGFPDWFDFVDQPDSISYKQLGNAVNVGVIFNVLKALVIRDIDLLKNYPKLTRSILGAPSNPDHILENYSKLFSLEERDQKIPTKNEEKALKLA
jgi:DNA (cytosine-5)-methyltransferase 1